MKNKNIIFLLFVFLLSACSFSSSENIDKNPENLMQTPVASTEVVLPNGNNLEAVTNNETSEAILIEDQQAVAEKENKEAEINRNEDLSLVEKAKKNKSISDCDEIKDGEIKSICKDEIYFAQAVEKKNSATCDKISFDKAKEDCKLAISAE